MLEIGMPIKKINRDYISIIYPVRIDDKENKLFFKFDKQYEKYLTVDRSDAVLVLFINYAIENGHDIKLDLPVSERLLYQLQQYYILAVAGANPDFHKVNILCTSTEEVYPIGEAVGTAMSCGVDSLSTFYLNNVMQDIEHYKISILTLFDIGAYTYPDGKEIPGAYDIQKMRAKSVADELGLPLMTVQSNYTSILPRYLQKEEALRNCSIILLFQKLFRAYYFSSTYPLNEFTINQDMLAAYFDIFTLPNISTYNTQFYSGGASYTRFEKTKLLSEYDLAKRHLSVCFIHTDTNCGTCAKCARTLLTLDALDKLESFEDAFNLDKYKKTKKMQIGYAIASKRNIFYGEIFIALKRAGKIPWQSYIYAFGFTVVKPIEKGLGKLSSEKQRKLVAFAEKHNIRVPY